MSIYQLNTDSTNYDALLVALVPVTDEWRKEGFSDWLDVGYLLNSTPIADRWHPIPVEEAHAERRKNRGKPVDFLHIDTGSVLAISERARDIIAPLVASVIEALPLENLTHPERRYFAVNTLDLVDCLDEQQSAVTRFDDGAIMDVKKFVFRPGTTEGHHLFRLAQVPFGPPILASMRFKQLVEQNKLVGLEFHLVGEPTSDERSSVGKRAARKPKMR